MASILRYHPTMKRLKFAAPVVVAFALLIPGLAAQNATRAPSMRVAAPTHNFHASGPVFVPSFGGTHFRSPTPCCGTFSGSFTYGIGTPENPFYPPTLGGHHHGFNNGFAGGVLIPYAVPVYPYPYYGYDTNYQDSQDMQQQQADQEEEPPAPTIFEHRARRAAPPTQAAPADSYDNGPSADNGTAIATDVVAVQPAAAEPTSVLIFHDGHQLEVQNYAIVGDTLYDLTPGHPRKIALASIDIPATVEANDSRGVAFRVPVQN